MSDEDNRTQVLARAAVILETVASSGRGGIRLLDLANETDISRPTVHRILGSLRELGYVQQLKNRRYTLGVRLGLLGLAAPSPLQYTSELQKVAQNVADSLGDTVYIAMQYFDSVYYLARAHGGFPIRMQTVEVGDVQPMSATYSGIAILSQLPQQLQDHMISNLAQTERQEWSEIGTEQHQQLIRKAIDQFNDDGFLYGDDYVLPGLSGASILVPQDAGRQLVTLSVSAIHSRLPESRKKITIDVLQTASKKIQKILESSEEGAQW